MTDLLSIADLPEGAVAEILALSDDALAERLAAWRARQTEAVLDDPSNAGA